MKHLILIMLLFLSASTIAFSQQKSIISVATKKQNAVDSTTAKDSLIKIKLIQLALKNPQMQIADAGIRIAASDVNRAKSSWLNSLNASANINEFVVQNSAGALYYPKYNFGVLLPFDIVSKIKNQNITARENLNISSQIKKDKALLLKTQVLLAYENYKEKKELLFIEKSYIEYVLAADEVAQQGFANGDIPMEEMNKSHQAYLKERVNLVSKQKDLNIATIELEQLIGTSLAEELKL